MSCSQPGREAACAPRAEALTHGLHELHWVARVSGCQNVAPSFIPLDMPKLCFSAINLKAEGYM